MRRTFETIQDYEGVGVYERTDQGPRVSEEVRWGIYSASGMGQMPGTEELMAPLLQTDEQSGLVVIAYDKQALAVQTLEMMSFQPDASAVADPIQGQASFIVVGGGSSWVRDYVAQGYMVMINLASVSTASPRMMMTRDPRTIAQFATRGGGYAMVKGPSELAIQAAAFAAPPAPAPTCPPGTAWAPAQQQCVPYPPGAQDQPPAAAARAAAPKWLLPVAIGAGVFGLGALLWG